MRRDTPQPEISLLDWMMKLGGRLVGQIEDAILPPPPAAPNAMTDEELHSAIYNIGARLLNDLGEVVQDSFARHGYDLNEHRLAAPSP